MIPFILRYVTGIGDCVARHGSSSWRLTFLPAVFHVGLLMTMKDRELELIRSCVN